MSQLLEQPITELYEKEVERFIRTASQSVNMTLYRNRRASTRVHRSMPILFARVDNGPVVDQSATLYNVSNDGIAFYCDCGLPAGAILAVKVFWSDAHAQRLPAVVRHCDITQQGFLVGAQFAFHQPDVRELIESTPQVWYG